MEELERLKSACSIRLVRSNIQSLFLCVFFFYSVPTGIVAKIRVQEGLFFYTRRCLVHCFFFALILAKRKAEEEERRRLAEIQRLKEERERLERERAEAERKRLEEEELERQRCGRRSRLSCPRSLGRVSSSRAGGGGGETGR